MNAQTDIARLGKVAVLMGGTSAEREVSLKSGAAVLSALQSRGVDAHGMDVGADVLSQLQQGRYDRVFIALHGRGGEDGTLQGALEIMDLPYTGSGVMASALAMDKLRTKQIWQARGLPTPEYRILEQKPDAAHLVQELGLPMMIKPSHEGSSIGIAKVSTQDQLLPAWEEAAKYDNEVIAEAWVTGKEYTAAILGEQTLPMIRLETPKEIYDYEAKYLLDTTQYHCPCGLAPEIEAKMQQLALQAFRAVGARGWGRIDLFVDEAGNPWLIEANTVPGLTDHSLVPMAARAAGIEFDELMLRILQDTL
ncbi:MAG: D-alanine--D-alanine ligase [Gammaproteobacteria bacterium]|nr:D-alanine--D-alanine ligase [Gammaproteobacteria bacterium]MDH5800074.1 D-alanine--D-alanine ligase [Gammaproteobacteria bacterium]